MHPQKVFSVDWNLSFVYVNQLFPLFPPCSAREAVLIDEWKIARTFSKYKGVSNFAEVEIVYNVEVKWTMAERNTCSCNTFWLRKVFQVAKSFRLYENTNHEQVLQWNKSMKQKISGMSRGKVLLWNETIFYKKWILCESCRLGTYLIYTFPSSSYCFIVRTITSIHVVLFTSIDIMNVD